LTCCSQTNPQAEEATKERWLSNNARLLYRGPIPIELFEPHQLNPHAAIDNVVSARDVELMKTFDEWYKAYGSDDIWAQEMYPVECVLWLPMSQALSKKKNAANQLAHIEKHLELLAKNGQPLVVGSGNKAKLVTPDNFVEYCEQTFKSWEKKKLVPEKMPSKEPLPFKLGLLVSLHFAAKSGSELLAQAGMHRWAAGVKRGSTVLYANVYSVEVLDDPKFIEAYVHGTNSQKLEGHLKLSITFQDLAAGRTTWEGAKRKTEEKKDFPNLQNLFKDLAWAKTVDKVSACGLRGGFLTFF
jgi:hypothetical protein